jgi:CheY-like chemotaxis protein
MKFRKILLIDNSDIDNFINASVVRRSGLVDEIVSLSSGSQGLKHLISVEDKPTEIPEIILLDLGMQIMDGFEFLELFQRLPASISAFTKIIVVTSSIDPDDRKRSLSYSCVIELIEKPLKLERLVDLLTLGGWPSLA